MTVSKYFLNPLITRRSAFKLNRITQNLTDFNSTRCYKKFIRCFCNSQSTQEPYKCIYVPQKLYNGEPAVTQWANTSFWYFDGKCISKLQLAERRAIGRSLTYPITDEIVHRDKYAVNHIPMKTLILLMITSGIPFIGFGFLDNLIMIMAGDYIDQIFGSVFCISTMAAAALGNTLSDVAGVGSAAYVERLAQSLGFVPPKLNSRQSHLKICTRIIYTGRVIGIILGCLLGMFPLIFLHEEEDEEVCDTTESVESSPMDHYIRKKAMYVRLKHSIINRLVANIEDEFLVYT